MGTLCGRSERVITRGLRVIDLLLRNIDVQHWYEERGKNLRLMQKPSTVGIRAKSALEYT